jgi:mono/diheme cytochrome c family protein
MQGSPTVLQTHAFRTILTSLCLSFFAGTALAEPPSEEQLKFFETKIRPLLAEHCYACHGQDEQESDLRLDTFAGMIGGGTSGPAMTPGKPEESLIYSAVTYKDEFLQMPPEGKLPDEQIALLQEWINQGAPHPERDGPLTIQPRKGAIDLDEARQFWAFQPIVRPPVPDVDDADWARNPIDAFLLAQLDAEGLTPAPPADKRTLIRRATFDLTGLPPTPEEIAAFLNDDSPQAFEKVIDRLLDSKRYGERWGRHWLDVARYADSNGLDENVAHGNAWRYRDYVVASFNEDKPFDRFILEQVAGDLLAALGPDDTLNPQPSTLNEHEPLIATGFLTLGPKVLAEGDQDKLQMDIVDEQIDTLGRAFLGMTLGCARCHDHKFDPVGIDDYYSLAGIFKSTRTMETLKRIAKWNENVIASPEQLEEKRRHEEQIAAKQQEIATVIERTKAELTTALEEEASTETDGEAEPKKEITEEDFPEETQARLKELREELKRLEETVPELPTAMGVQEAEEITDTRIHVRGSHLTLGRPVERGIPAVFTDAPLKISEEDSGRMQLARWLVSDENPLTARVIANRLWRWHFGQGLVPTPDNFGRLGEAPVNPELLDWLAIELRENGWSLKSLHKRIMLSATYRMSSRENPDNHAIDPENRFQWRAPVRRLEAEAIRDSLLAVSGLLDETMGGSMLHVKNRAFLFDHTSKDTTSYDSHRRSLYLPVIRNNLYDGFSLFDYADSDVPQGNRNTSTVAPQALFLMNSDLLLETSAALSDRLFTEQPEDEQARVARLYELTLGRLPESHETDRFLTFVKRFEKAIGESSGEEDIYQTAWTAACQTILGTNEFLYVQ